jgi:hypothetical protein
VGTGSYADVRQGRVEATAAIASAGCVHSSQYHGTHLCERRRGVQRQSMPLRWKRGPVRSGNREDAEIAPAEHRPPVLTRQPQLLAPPTGSLHLLEGRVGRHARREKPQGTYDTDTLRTETGSAEKKKGYSAKSTPLGWIRGTLRNRSRGGARVAPAEHRLSALPQHPSSVTFPQLFLSIYLRGGR